MSLSYEIATGSSAKIAVREDLPWVKRKQATHGKFPFEATIEDGRLRLTIPVYASVKVRDGVRWVKVHDGSSWGPQGVASEPDTLSLNFALGAQVQVHAQGHTWTLGLMTGLGPEKKEPFVSVMRRNRYLGYSILGHVFLMGFLVSMVRLDQIIAALGWQSKDTLDPNASVTANDLEFDSGGGEEAAYHPFQGISYSDFRHRLSTGEITGNELNALLKNLDKLDLSASGKGGTAGTGTAPQRGSHSPLFTGLGGSSTGKGTGLTQSVQSQKFQDAAGSRGAGGRKLTDKEQAMVREKFRELQAEFKKIYSRVLGIDPTFAVTVAYEVKVQPTGYLAISSFKARGNYQAPALAKLQEEMGEVIRSTFVGAELVGTLIRGENVFVR